MHSFLVCGVDAHQNYQQALKLAGQFLNVPVQPGKTIDFFYLHPENSSENLKINQIRQLKKDLATRPLAQPMKVALIHQAHQLTLAAQNALLKTLEEPPGKTKIIITSDQPGLLLDTIISRCEIRSDKQTTKLDGKQLADQETIARQLSNSSLGARLRWADQQNFTRTQLTDLIESQIQYWHQQLTRSDTWAINHALSALKTLQEAAKLTRTQVNHSLILDQLLMAFPGPKNKNGVAKKLTSQ